MTKCVVLMDEMTQEQEDEFREYISKRGWGFWHWTPLAWLIHCDEELSNPDTINAIRDEILRIAPNTYSAVLEVQPTRMYAGYGPSSKERDMFEWIEEHWVSKS